MNKSDDSLEPNPGERSENIIPSEVEVISRLCAYSRTKLIVVCISHVFSINYSYEIRVLRDFSTFSISSLSRSDKTDSRFFSNNFVLRFTSGSNVILSFKQN